MVHTFERGGLRLALDTESGAVHIVDRLAFLLLNDRLNEAESEYSKKDIDKAFSELKLLEEKGQLFSPENKVAMDKAQATKPILKAMCLHMAHACNLECRYCFAKGGKFGGKWELMPLETATKAIEMLCRASGSRRNLEVDFFGGEPLLNFDVIKQTVTFARELEKKHNKNFRFTITTNGVLLDDEVINYINSEMDNIVISLDGRPDVNDFNRKKLSGEGCYDLVMPKFKKLVKKRGDKSYYIRGTFTIDNLDFEKDVFHLFNEGFKNISIEPVSGEGCDYSLDESHLDEIAIAYQKIFDKLCNTDELVFFHLLTDLSGGPCAIKRIRGCGAGCEYLAVTPTGQLYPCHQFVGEDSYIMGNLNQGITKQDIYDDFFNTTLLSKVECSDCFAKYFCSGGCAAASYNATGDIKGQDIMYCKLMRLRTEYAIALVAKRSIMHH